VAGDHTEPLALGTASSPPSGHVVTGNTILNQLGQTACITSVGMDDFTLEGNLLGGGGWVLYLNSQAQAGLAGNIVRGNWLTTQFFPRGGSYGVLADGPSWGSGGNAWDCNWWYDGPLAGQPVPS
jgi:hypothetical protein